MKKETFLKSNTKDEDPGARNTEGETLASYNLISYVQLIGTAMKRNWGFYPRIEARDP